MNSYIALYHRLDSATEGINNFGRFVAQLQKFTNEQSTTDFYMLLFRFHTFGCCQTKSNTSQSTTITQIYEA